MARTDYGAILSTVIKDTSDAVREVNGTSSLIAPNQWGTAIRTMHSDSDYENALEQMIEETATGDIASFSDGANNIPCPSVLCTINPVQDLHGQDNPYPSGGGINIWDEEWEQGSINNSDGTNVNAGTNRIRSKNYIPCNASTSYYFYNGTSIQMFVYYYASDNSFISYAQVVGVFTTPSNCSYMRFRTNDNYGTTYGNNISINYPSSNTAYHPYSNICPITGHTELNLVHTGANLWDEEWELGAINTTNGQDTPANNRIRSKNYIACIPNTTYYIKSPSQGGLSVFFYDKSNAFIRYDYRTNATVTSPSNAWFMRFCNGGADLITYNHDISINYPSTDTDYHAYTGSTTTTNFGTTVYGCTLDVVSGVLTIDRAIVDMGSLSYTKFDVAEGTLFRTQINGAKTITNTNNVLCSAYHWVLKADRTNGTVSIPDSMGNIDFINDSYSDATVFKTAMTGQTVCYELATPTTIQLTPQEVKSLLGGNNIYHDCNGQVAVTYRANGQLYVAQH